MTNKQTAANTPGTSSRLNRASMHLCSCPPPALLQALQTWSPKCSPAVLFFRHFAPAAQQCQLSPQSTAFAAAADTSLLSPSLSSSVPRPCALSERMSSEAEDPQFRPGSRSFGPSSGRQCRTRCFMQGKGKQSMQSRGSGCWLTDQAAAPAGVAEAILQTGAPRWTAGVLVRAKDRRRDLARRACEAARVAVETLHSTRALSPAATLLSCPPLPASVLCCPLPSLFLSP